MKNVVLFFLGVLFDKMVQKQIGMLIINYILCVLNKNMWLKVSQLMLLLLEKIFLNLVDFFFFGSLFGMCKVIVIRMMVSIISMIQIVVLNLKIVSIVVFNRKLVFLIVFFDLVSNVIQWNSFLFFCGVNSLIVDLLFIFVRFLVMLDVFCIVIIKMIEVVIDQLVFNWVSVRRVVI